MHAEFTADQEHGGTATRGNGIYGHLGVCDFVEENQLAIWRPPGVHDPHRRKRKLHPLAPIDSAPPQRPIGVSDVGNPLAVGRDGNLTAGDSREVGDELFGIVIEDLEFAPSISGQGEEFLVIARHGDAPQVERPEG